MYVVMELKFQFHYLFQTKINLEKRDHTKIYNLEHQSQYQTVMFLWFTLISSQKNSLLATQNFGCDLLPVVYNFVINSLSVFLVFSVSRYITFTRIDFGLGQV